MEIVRKPEETWIKEMGIKPSGMELSKEGTGIKPKLIIKVRRNEFNRFWNGPGS